MELVIVDKSDEKRWFELEGQPITDQAGNLVRYFYLGTDITERKRLEQALEVQHHRTTAAVISAQEKERSLVGRELHDNINQMLTSAKLYLEMSCSYCCYDIKPAPLPCNAFAFPEVNAAAVL